MKVEKWFELLDPDAVLEAFETFETFVTVLLLAELFAALAEGVGCSCFVDFVDTL